MEEIKYKMANTFSGGGLMWSSLSRKKNKLLLRNVATTKILNYNMGNAKVMSIVGINFTEQKRISNTLIRVFQ